MTLQDGKKGTGRDGAERGVVPSRECFKAVQLSGGEAHLGLKKRIELVLVKRPANILFVEGHGLLYGKGWLQRYSPK